MNSKEGLVSIRKIDEHDESYILEQNVMRHLSGDPLRNVLGQDVLDSKNAMLDKQAAVLKDMFANRYSRTLQRTREELMNLLENPLQMRMPYIVDFFAQADNDVDTIKKIATQSKFGMTIITNRFRSELEDMSDDELEALLSSHVEKFQEDLAYFESRKGEWQQRFKKNITRKIERGEILLDADTLDRRLQNTHVVLADALREDLTTDMQGFFNADSEIVMVSQQDVRRAGENIYVHEMLHALSGRTIHVKEFQGLPEDPDFESEYSFIETQRIGLRFNGGKQKGEDRFRWLNEAVTESLSQELLPNPKEEIYKSEQKLYRLLQIKGKTPIDKNLFIAAYFENYDPSLPYGERITAWKKLYQTINEAYAPGFLVKFDTFIKNHGVQKAIRILERLI